MRSVCTACTARAEAELLTWDPEPLNLYGSTSLCRVQSHSDTYLIKMLSSWYMEFSMELELVCTGIGNELRFKLIRGHTPKLCFISLIPWLVFG